MLDLVKFQAISLELIEVLNSLWVVPLGLLTYLLLRPHLSKAMNREPAIASQISHVSEYEIDEDDDIVLPEQPQQDYTLFNALNSQSEDANIHDPPRKYIPLSAIQSLITRAAVEVELEKMEWDSPTDAQQFTQSQRAMLASWISQHARQVFAITLQCDFRPARLVFAMRMAKKHKFVDGCLPAPDNPSMASASWPDRFHPSIWDALKLEIFTGKQWAFDAAKFENGIMYYDFPAQKVFPFRGIGVASEDGAFSRVHQVKVHDAHHDFPDQGNVGTIEFLNDISLTIESRSL